MQNFDYVDINKRNFPDYEPFAIKEMLDDYSLATRFHYRYTRTNPRPMTIVTARGCPFSCTFCVHQKGPRYRARAVENIIPEIALLYERYHFNILVILDELFALDKSKLKKFSMALIDARKTLNWDFDWIFQTHLNASLDHNTLQMAKEAGAYFVSYGLESASPKVLASMNKKIKPSQIVKAIRTANDVKVGAGGYFIFGDIAETASTISETMNFFSQYCLDAFVKLGDVQPYPGSKVFDHCMNRGIVSNKSEYYEHIGERLFNMTSIPDVLWFPWIRNVKRLGLSFLWAKSADASRCSKESETAANPMVLHFGRPILKIWVRCPHCNKEVYRREPLWAMEQKQKEIPSGAFGSLPFKIFNIYRQIRSRNTPIFYSFWILIFKLVKRLIRKVIWLFIRGHPIFRLLKPHMVDKEQAPLSFITGCPHCNKPFRVNISTPAFESRSN
jgi:hypothetical protein